MAGYITTPLRGGEGKNATVHFNVCKTSLLENWKKIKKDVPPTDHLVFFRVRRQNVILHFDVLPVFSKYVRSTCYFFPPTPQFSKILLKWGGGESKKVLYCYIFTSPPKSGNEGGGDAGYPCALSWAVETCT